MNLPQKKSIRNPRLVSDVSVEDLEKVKKSARKLSLSVASFVRLAVFDRINKENVR